VESFCQVHIKAMPVDFFADFFWQLALARPFPTQFSFLFACLNLRFNLFFFVNLRLRIFGRHATIILLPFACANLRLRLFGCLNLRFSLFACANLRLRLFGCLNLRFSLFACANLRLRLFGCFNLLGAS